METESENCDNGSSGMRAKQSFGDIPSQAVELGTEGDHVSTPPISRSVFYADVSSHSVV